MGVEVGKNQGWEINQDKFETAIMNPTSLYVSWRSKTEPSWSPQEQNRSPYEIVIDTLWEKVVSSRWELSPLQTGRQLQARLAQHLDLELLTSKTGRGQCLLLKPPTLWYSVIAASTSRPSAEPQREADRWGHCDPSSPSFWYCSPQCSSEFCWLMHVVSGLYTWMSLLITFYSIKLKWILKRTK